jgi:hypothetical protein
MQPYAQSLVGAIDGMSCPAGYYFNSGQCLPIPTDPTNNPNGSFFIYYCDLQYYIESGSQHLCWPISTDNPGGRFINGYFACNSGFTTDNSGQCISSSPPSPLSEITQTPTVASTTPLLPPAAGNLSQQSFDVAVTTTSMKNNPANAPQKIITPLIHRLGRTMASAPANDLSPATTNPTSTPSVAASGETVNSGNVSNEGFFSSIGGFLHSLFNKLFHLF